MTAQVDTEAVSIPAVFERLDSLNLLVARRIAFTGVLGMLGISLLIIVDIVLKNIVRMPVIGLNEYVQMFFAVAVAATFPAAIATRGHLRISILGNISERLKAWLTVLGSVFLFVLFFILAWQVWLKTIDVGEQGLTTQIVRLPHQPFFIVITAILVLCVISQAIVLAVDTARADVSGTGGYLTFRTPLVFLAVAALFAWFYLGFDDFARSATNFAWQSPARLAGIVFGLMWVSLLLYIPISAVTGLLAVGASAMMIGTNPALSVIGSELTTFITNPDVSVLPLFLLMGILAAAAGISNDVYRLAEATIGHLRGGLALATIGGCAGFGAVTGSSIATVATIGSSSLPEMDKRGYSRTLSTGAIAAGGTLGSLVPPSGALVVYAFLTEESIGQLFVAALIPATIAILFYMLTIMTWVTINPAAEPERGTFKAREVVDAFRQGLPVFAMFTIVMGGIYTGLFTVNEAAAVGAVSALLIAFFRGKLKGNAFWRIMGEAASLTSMIYALIIGGLTLSFFVGATDLATDLTNYVSGLNLTPLITICCLLLVYILLGTIMEAFAIMIITVPIVSGLILSMDFSLIWWGIIMLVVLEIGQISPPFGMNVFVLQSVSGKGTKLSTIYKGVLPFLVSDLVKLALLILIPSLVLWLPSTTF
ncbi:MAG: TRAP transporter large permease [Pseudomonadota bacterium]